MIGRGEVDLEGKALLEAGVVVELGAIVESDGLEVAAVTADSAGGGVRDFVHGAGFELLDDGVAGFAFDQREDAVMHVAAHHGVAFPVANALAQFGLGRPITDWSLAGEHAPGIMAAVALATEFAEDAGVVPQVAAGPLVPANLPVDRLVTDAQATRPFPYPDDLLGTEPTAHQPRDLSHVGRAEVGAAAAAATPGGSIAVRFLRAVLGVMSGDIAAQFPADGARVTLQLPGDLGARASAHPQRRDPVSFFLGELVIRRHGCNPVPGRMRRQLVSPLPTQIQDVLHLPCESASPFHSVNRTRRHTTSYSLSVAGGAPVTLIVGRQPEGQWPISGYGRSVRSPSWGIELRTPLLNDTIK